jgi:hypothetical protein
MWQEDEVAAMKRGAPNTLKGTIVAATAAGGPAGRKGAVP